MAFLNTRGNASDYLFCLRIPHVLIY
jgi:hypothetical protein